jgi:hypothetical protein
MEHPKPEAPGATELCVQCGHFWNPHRLLGYGNPPTEGWMECPVEGCTCRMTWSAEPKLAAGVKEIQEAGKRAGDAPP